jgi:hypothetical protein
VTPRARVQELPIVSEDGNKLLAGTKLFFTTTPSGGLAVEAETPGTLDTSTPIFLANLRSKHVTFAVLDLFFGVGAMDPVARLNTGAAFLYCANGADFDKRRPDPARAMPTFGFFHRRLDFLHGADGAVRRPEDGPWWWLLGPKAWQALPFYKPEEAGGKPAQEAAGKSSRAAAPAAAASECNAVDPSVATGEEQAAGASAGAPAAASPGTSKAAAGGEGAAAQPPADGSQPSRSGAERRRAVPAQAASLTMARHARLPPARALRHEAPRPILELAAAPQHVPLRRMLTFGGLASRVQAARILNAQNVAQACGGPVEALQKFVQNHIVQR